MKCEYCQNEPIRACLLCGAFYCKSHGRFMEALKLKGQPIQNSLCMKCSERTGKQMKTLGIVFIGIGLAMLTLGGIIAAASGEPAVGLIFLLQGFVFGIIGLVFRSKHSKDNNPF